MARFSFRKYEDGDEVAINQLYFDVTGTSRTAEEFRWQWLSAPAGVAEMWLIEYHADDGNVILVGHHGMMPLFFSNGPKNLIAGKTENTMVLPEFRRKILYPKFEKKFLESYKHKFDLLFSTTGPAAALRQRKALGYSSDEHWKFYDWGVRPGAVFSRIGYSLELRKNEKFGMGILSALFKTTAFILNKFYSNQPRCGQQVDMTILSSEQARQHPFFEKFWDNCRDQYGITPRRYREDLAWRFWDNPFGSCKTILFDLSNDVTAYAIVRKRAGKRYSIEDLVCSKPIPSNFKILIETLCHWGAEQGSMYMSYSTTSDDPEMIASLNAVEYDNILDLYPYSRTQKAPSYMLRKVCTERGNTELGDVKNWFVTGFYFEGRE